MSSRSLIKYFYILSAIKEKSAKIFVHFYENALFILEWDFLLNIPRRHFDSFKKEYITHVDKYRDNTILFQ